MDRQPPIVVHAHERVAPDGRQRSSPRRRVRADRVERSRPRLVPLADEVGRNVVRGEAGAEAEEPAGRRRLGLGFLEREAPRRRDGLGVVRAQPALAVEGVAAGAVRGEVVVERDPGVVDVGRGLLQREREVAQLSGHAAGHLALGLRGVLDLGARKEERDGLRAGEPVDLDLRRDAAPPLRPRRDEDVAAPLGREVGPDSVAVLGVVEDEEPAVVGAPPVAEGGERRVGSRVGSRDAEGDGEGGQVVAEDGGIFGADEPADVVIVAVAAGELKGNLGLADAAESGEGREGDAVASRQRGADVGEAVLAAGEGLGGLGEGPEGGFGRQRRRRLDAYRLGGTTDGAGHVGERLVLVRPARDGAGVLRGALDLPERGAGPVAVAEDDGDDARVAVLVTLHRPFDLDVPAVVGGEEVGANEEEDDVGRLQVTSDLAVPLLAHDDLAVVPLRDHAVPLEEGEMRRQSVA